FDAPAADGAEELERQGALVAEAEFEHPAIVLAARGRDGLSRAEMLDEPGIAAARLVVVLTGALVAAGLRRPGQARVDAHPAAEQGEPRVHPGIGSGHAR